MFERPDLNRGPDEPDDGLEGLLTELGPLMARQEAAEGRDPNSDFGASLRARLVETEPREQPAPSVVPRRHATRRLAPWGGVAGAALVAAMFIIALNLRSSSITKKPVAAPSGRSGHLSFVPPTPAAADLTKSYPTLGGLGGGGLVSPVASRIETIVGQVYPGRLTIRGSLLPVLPTHLPAYQLKPAPRNLRGRMALFARTLGIHVSVTQQTGYVDPSSPSLQVRFLVATQGSGTLTHPIKSVAVSRFNGVLIYHDTTDDAGLLQRSPSPTVTRAVSLSRAWLVALGWPGRAMPVTSTHAFPGIRQIDFSWAGVPRVDASAASLWVDYRGRITEALLYPPVLRTTSLPAVPVSRSWALLRVGRIPVGVKILTGTPNAPGAAVLRRVSTEQVLTTTPAGVQYLVPSYRFEGIARIRGAPGTHQWFALAPAVGP